MSDIAAVLTLAKFSVKSVCKLNQVKSICYNDIVNATLIIVYLDTELSTTDLRDVKIKLRNAAFDNTEWRKLGEELGLRKGTMNVISKNNPGDTERCYTECLTKWLERADDVDDCHGKPTLRLLADALDNINLTQVADKIRKYIPYITLIT